MKIVILQKNQEKKIQNLTRKVKVKKVKEVYQKVLVKNIRKRKKEKIKTLGKNQSKK